MKWVPVFVYGGGDIYDVSAVDHDPVTMKPDSDSYELYEIQDPITLTAQDIINGGDVGVLEMLMRAGKARRK